MDSNKKILLSVVGIAILIVALTGVTLSFFNYTRTGAANNIGTGRIYFNSTQNGTLNLTNIFPMKSTESSNANLDSVTIGIQGDTTYSNGEEYEIKIVDINNTINGKQIPMNYIATYEAASGKTIGAASNDYWNEREDKDTNIYTLSETGKVEEGKRVLVGFIKNDNTGINGTLTIKAYIDADRIAISDTYSESGEGYYVNVNMSQSEINDCVSYFEELEFDEDLEEGESLESFCVGTGTIAGHTFQYGLDNDYLYDENLEYLVEHNIIVYQNYSNGTTNEWVNGRTVLTTTEWNSLSSTPISFKIRAESNEGVWVEAPMIAQMCPGCVFAYNETPFYTTWNTTNQSPSVLTSSDYKEDYEDVIASSGKNFFLGLKLNSSNQIEKAYVCGLYNETTPFCIEGYYDGTKYETNKEILQDTRLWNNTCDEFEDPNVGYITRCSSQFPNMCEAVTHIDGTVGVEASGQCSIYQNGSTDCQDYIGE